MLSTVQSFILAASYGFAAWAGYAWRNREQLEAIGEDLAAIRGDLAAHADSIKILADAHQAAADARKLEPPPGYFPIDASPFLAPNWWCRGLEASDAGDPPATPGG